MLEFNLCGRKTLNLSNEIHELHIQLLKGAEMCGNLCGYLVLQPEKVCEVKIFFDLLIKE